VWHDDTTCLHDLCARLGRPIISSHARRNLIGWHGNLTCMLAAHQNTNTAERPEKERERERERERESTVMAVRWFLSRRTCNVTKRKTRTTSPDRCVSCFRPASERGALASRRLADQVLFFGVRSAGARKHSRRGARFPLPRSRRRHAERALPAPAPALRLSAAGDGAQGQNRQASPGAEPSGVRGSSPRGGGGASSPASWARVSWGWGMAGWGLGRPRPRVGFEYSLRCVSRAGRGGTGTVLNAPVSASRRPLPEMWTTDRKEGSAGVSWAQRLVNGDMCARFTKPVGGKNRPPPVTVYRR
jgi:hypothetical protein